MLDINLFSIGVVTTEAVTPKYSWSVVFHGEVIPSPILKLIHAEIRPIQRRSRGLDKPGWIFLSLQLYSLKVLQGDDL